ncbi:MAG: hypothetical protein P8X64_06835 [Anaerolineales bacterium]
MMSVGLLAGSLLPLLSKGMDLTSASASAAAGARHPRILKINYRLDPQDPSQVSQVQLRLAEQQGTPLETLQIRFDDQAGTWIPCYDMEETWVCPVMGLSVEQLSQVEVISS